MISYLENSEIDRKKWDDCIGSSINSLIYAYSWYLDEACYNWDALVLDDYEAVFPIPYNSKFGFKYCLQPIFGQQLGLFVRQTEHLKFLSDFLNHIPKKFRFVKLNLNSLNKQAPRLLSKKDHLLDLIADYDTLYSAYSKRQKRNLKKAQDSKCTLLSGVGASDFIDLYRDTVGKKGLFRESEYGRLENIMNACLSKGSLEIVGVYSPVNHLCSAGAFLKDENRIYYLSGASDSMGKEYFAMVSIFDHIIKKYAGKKLILDFEGSEVKGIAEFFQGFGAMEVNYYEYADNRLPWPLKGIVDKKAGMGL